MPPIKLVTKAQWEKMSARTRGYLGYMQGNFPGSELHGITCPYPKGSQEAKDYAAGEFAAMMDAQDSEE